MIKQAITACLFALLVNIFVGKLFQQRNEISITQKLNTSYDYVIVGSGAAGSVLASRLSEREDVTVLLVEAGGHYDEIASSHIPGLWSEMLHTDFDWDFYTEPQSWSSFGLNSGRSYWPRGRVLGGSTVTNLLQYTRGSRFDFDEWESLGCAGWSYKDVLPYFKKSEDILVPELANSDFHGKGGRFAVSDGKYTKMPEFYVNACKELGYEEVDYNGEEQEGFSSYQVNVRNGVRSSTSKEFLKVTQGRPNIHIAIRTIVTRVEIQSKRATGVYVIRDGRKRFIKANKEVILSGGAINSPQLLMLSGIGPKQHLEELGIEVVSDLPVGENLQDHLRLQLFVSINESFSVTSDMKNTFLDRLKYHFFGKGNIAYTGGEITLFVYTDAEKMRNKTYTNVQMNFFSSFAQPNVVNVKDTIHEEIFRDKKGKHGFMTALIMNHMKSTGTIKLRSTDPFDSPVMDPRYLSEGSDVEDMLKAIRLWEQIINTKTMQKLNASIEHLNLDICKEHAFRSDDYWRCYIKHLAMTVYHPCCTCKQGAADDSSAVVDSHLRVKGIQGLRVVDTSIFPQETSGNLNAPTIMVAEKGADLILEDV